MKYPFGIASKIWSIAYPVLMYYVAVVVGTFLAQMIFGTETENYMLCKMIGSLVAIPVVFADYRHDRMLTGKWGLRRKFTREGWKEGLRITGITVCISISLNNLILMSPLAELSSEYENTSQVFYAGGIGLEIVSLAIVTPVLEELLHRGVVFGRLKHMAGVPGAVVVSALIFAGLHFNIVQFTYAFLLGIVLAVFMNKTDCLAAPVWAHMLANLIAVIRTETGFLKETTDGSLFAWSISVVLLITGCIGIGIYMGKGKENERGNQ